MNHVWIFFQLQIDSWFLQSTHSKCIRFSLCLSVWLSVCLSVNLSVYLSVCGWVRAKREIWSKRVFMRTNGNFSFQRALKEYYNYSLISTCTEGSWYFWEMIMTVRLYARKRYAVIESSDLMRNIPWLASCFCKIKNPNKKFLRSKCDWQCSYFDTILAIYS